MLNSKSISLSRHRLDCALNTIEEAEGLLNINKYKGCNNRAYYAIFYCIRAVLALDGIDFKKHSGVIAHFLQFYVKTNRFSAEFSRIIRDASVIRNQSDYNDFYIATKEETEKQLTEAKMFYEAVKEYLDTETKD